MSTEIKGAKGWNAASARMYTRGRREVRLRVHETCVLDGDDRLGLSALTGAKCDRCKLAIQGAGTMVRWFPSEARPPVVKPEAKDLKRNETGQFS
jgi:hypothetical protein